MGRKEKSKSIGANSITSKTAAGLIDACAYTCTGDFPTDFNELWGRSYPDCDGVPLVKSRCKTEGGTGSKSVLLDNHDEAMPCITIPNQELYQPSVQCDFEVEETKTTRINYAKDLYIRSWKVHAKVVEILQQCMLEKLKTLNLWNVGMTEESIAALALALKNIPSVKSLVIEGNPIPKCEPFHLLLDGSTSLTHLSLRNNFITDVGAKNIGTVLGSIICPLINLNLSFNRIGDEGAKAIAKALRINRTLLSLSLSSNLIGDEGCMAIASSLKRFVLTPEEIVERRRLNFDSLTRSFEPRGRSSGSKSTGIGVTAKSGKAMPKKGGKQDSTEKRKETPDKSKNSKKPDSKRNSLKKKPILAEGSQESEVEEVQHPLLHPKTDLIEGKIYIPGCLSLLCLNLSRNRIGEDGLHELLEVVEHQLLVGRTDVGYLEMPGLIKLYLEKNKFSQEHPDYLKINEHLGQRDPLLNSSSNEYSSSAQN